MNRQFSKKEKEKEKLAINNYIEKMLQITNKRNAI